MKRASPGRQPAVFSRIEIVFEDEAVIVVEKPPGLLTIATAREKDRTLYAWLFDHVKRRRPPEKIFIVHRLDRDASGLLVFAKTAEAKQFLQRQFSNRTAGRVYKALVEGRVVEDVRIIQSHLAENRAHRSYSTSDERLGKQATTHVRVLKRSSRRTLVEIELGSGRKHQIRVHMAEWGHAIVGDKVYGKPDARLGRLALHADRLRFRHPLTGEHKEFESPRPVVANWL